VRKRVTTVLRFSAKYAILRLICVSARPIIPRQSNQIHPNAWLPVTCKPRARNAIRLRKNTTYQLESHKAISRCLFLPSACSLRCIPSREASARHRTSYQDCDLQYRRVYSTFANIGRNVAILGVVGVECCRSELEKELR
jgi:hypothetical protein